MKSIYRLLIGVLCSGAALAAGPYGAAGPASVMPPMMAPQAVNPAVTLRQGIDHLMQFLHTDPRPSAAELAGFLDHEIAPFFDFDYMSRAAAGPLLEQLGPEQQAAVSEQIRRSFLNKMARKLAAYDNQQVRFLPPRRGDDGTTAEVGIAIMNPGRYPSRMDFRLYRGANGWRVYDVAANGQSAIVYYRRQMQDQLRQRQMQQMRPAHRMAPPMYPRSQGPGRQAPGR